MIDLSNLNWPHIINNLPFIGRTVKGEHTPFATKIIESLLVAMIPVLFTWLVAIPKMQEQVTNVSIQVEHNHQENKEQLYSVAHQIDKIDDKVEKLNDKVDRNSDLQRNELDGVKKDLWKGVK